MLVGMPECMVSTGAHYRQQSAGYRRHCGSSVIAVAARDSRASAVMRRS